ncbi:MAG: tetratricopeptide repeat protein [bacterium]|nr:tetratricopeptide repeat protein [bacterium]
MILPCGTTCFGKKAILWSVLLLVTIFTVACSNSSENNRSSTVPKLGADSISRSNKTFLTDCKILYQEAHRLDSVLMHQTEMDKPSANAAIKAFVDFANYCHQDTLSPVFLIKTAQVAKAINNIPQAKLVLDKCVKDYPLFRDRDAALFLLAQLYDEDNYMNDEVEARRIYEQIISEYPKSDWALSAKGAIHFLGKSDEQIMKELKKKH